MIANFFFFFWAHKEATLLPGKNKIQSHTAKEGGAEDRLTPGQDHHEKTNYPMPAGTESTQITVIPFLEQNDCQLPFLAKVCNPVMDSK
jgi:hypothetical protein